MVVLVPKGAEVKWNYTLKRCTGRKAEEAQDERTLGHLRKVQILNSGLTLLEERVTDGSDLH